PTPLRSVVCVLSRSVDIARLPTAAANRAPDPDRQSLLEQNRPLLDVDFEISNQLLAAARERGDLRRIEARIPHDRRQGMTAGIAPLQQFAVETSRYRAAAEKARREAHALLFRECDDVEMKRQLAANPLKVLDQHERRHDA